MILKKTWSVISDQATLIVSRVTKQKGTIKNFDSRI